MNTVLPHELEPYGPTLYTETIGRPEAKLIHICCMAPYRERFSPEVSFRVPHLAERILRHS